MLASPPTLERHHDFIWLLTPTTATTPKLCAFDETKKIPCNFAEAYFFNSQNCCVFYTNIGLDRIFLVQLSFVAIGLECKNALFCFSIFILSAKDAFCSAKPTFSLVDFWFLSPCLI
jgi:hypothetical protein